MVAQLLIGPKETEAFAGLLRPEPLPDGTKPEERIILCGVLWERYLALDKALGDDRSGPRFYYLDGELEILTTSSDHERIKKWIGGFLEIYSPDLDLSLLERCVAIPSWRQARQTFRAGLSKPASE